MAPLISSALRPLVRIIVGLIAIPLFRLFIRRVMKWDKFDAELTKDIEQWVRGSLMLLLATANVEHALVSSLSWHSASHPIPSQSTFRQSPVRGRARKRSRNR